MVERAQRLIGRRQEASCTRRHVGDRRGSPHRRAQRVRLPDPRRQALSDRELRRTERAVGDGVRLLARIVPTPRTRGRRAPSRPGARAGSVARRWSSAPRSSAASSRWRLPGRHRRVRPDRRPPVQRPSVAALRAVRRASSATTSRSSTRGTLAGNGRFSAYGAHARRRKALSASSSASRCSSSAGPRSVSTVLRSRSRRSSRSRSRCADRTSLLTPGPEAPYSELSSALAWLLLGSVLAQLLSYASVLGVQLFATAHQKDIARQLHHRPVHRPHPAAVVPGRPGRAAAEALAPGERGQARRLPQRHESAARDRRRRLRRGNRRRDAARPVGGQAALRRRSGTSPTATCSCSRWPPPGSSSRSRWPRA